MQNQRCPTKNSKFRQARLKGQDDLMPGMGMGDSVMPEKRTYYLFNDGLSGSTDDHTFKLLITAKEGIYSG